MRGIPCLTTVQALAAAVQGIEAMRGGDIGVASLQQHHTLITAARAAAAAAGYGGPEAGEGEPA
jgi:carbamoyl-phosphate synthase large subunit